MKNFSIMDNTGREYWISRSVAVVALVELIINSNSPINPEEDYYILAVKRGKGTPDPEFVNCWCLPCGYLDYDETCKEAVVREVFEETGLKLSPDSLYFEGIDSNPTHDKRQNVNIRYLATLVGKNDPLEFPLTSKNSEKDEISELAWIKVSDIDKFKWAFNHDIIVKNYFDWMFYGKED